MGVFYIGSFRRGFAFLTLLSFFLTHELAFNLKLSRVINVQAAESATATPEVSGYTSNRREDLISVHVLGEVAKPGTFYLRATERALDAIQLAGGLTANGSETRIELRRAGRVLRKVNILEMRRLGDLRNNPFIQDNDVIFVPFRGPSVTIQGPIKYPAVYEIEKDTTAWDLVEMAGGFSIGLAIDRPASVIRFHGQNSGQVLEVNTDEKSLKALKLMDGDTLTLPHKLTADRSFTGNVSTLPNDRLSYPSFPNEVFVLGGVKKPGKFPFVAQQRLTYYVAQAGGLERLGREDLLVSRSGQKPLTVRLNSDFPVYPGDTITVGEDKLGPEFWIGFMTSLVGLGLSAAAFFGR